MGVYRLANHLRDLGYSVKVIHSWIRINDDQFMSVCDKYINESTMLVGLGATVLADLELGEFFGITESRTKKRITAIKNKFPWVQTCIGGAQITGASDEFISRLDFFDWAIKGQGEAAITALLSHIKTGDRIKTATITRPKIITDKTYNFDHFNNTFNTFIEDDSIVNGEGLPIEIARGCIFKCKFCGYDLIGKKAGEYTKHSSIIRKELIENYERWGTTDYYVADETINDSLEKVKMLVDSVSNLPFKPRFGGFMRLDLIWKYPEMAQLLLDWGVETCSFGIETINDASGKSVGKGLGVKRIEETLDHLKSVWNDRVFVNASFILGFKYDSQETAKDLDLWLDQQFKKKNLHEVFVKPLYIMPKTGTSFLDQYYVDQGYRILDNVIDDKNEYMRAAEQGQIMVWETDLWNYLLASRAADEIHKKFNNEKICKGKIGKHNFAFVKSIIPLQYKDHLISSMINNEPFPGLTITETESVIYKSYEEFNQRYINSILKEK